MLRFGRARAVIGIKAARLRFDRRTLELWAGRNGDRVIDAPSGFGIGTS